MTDETITTAAPEEELPSVQTESTPVLPETVTVADIQFRSGSKVYFFDPNGLNLKPGDHVIMDTARGQEFGYCTGGNHSISSKDVVAPLRKVLRIATEKDEKINEDYAQTLASAVKKADEKI